jgi:hypothetical protein
VATGDHVTPVGHRKRTFPRKGRRPNTWGDCRRSPGSSHGKPLWEENLPRKEDVQVGIRGNCKITPGRKHFDLDGTKNKEPPKVPIGRRVGLLGLGGKRLRIIFLIRKGEETMSGLIEQ